MAPETIDEWQARLRRLVRPFPGREATAVPLPARQAPAAADGSTRMGELKATLRSISDSVRYLHNRRGEPSFAVASEDDLQDLIYVSLKPRFPDLVYEEPTKKGSAGYSIADFSIPELDTLVEAKLILKKSDVKPVGGEIAEDIWNYSNNTDCRAIIFFVFDPNLAITDRQQFIRGAKAEPGSYQLAGRSIEIDTIVGPA